MPNSERGAVMKRACRLFLQACVVGWLGCWSLAVAASPQSQVVLSAEAKAKQPPVAQASSFWVFIGTFTRGESRGIYRCVFDSKTGSLSSPELAVETVNPAFLAVHPQARFLYAVNEIGKFNGKRAGAVSAFALDVHSGKLALLNQQSTESPGPCHLAVDRQGRFVAVANYSGGSVTVLPLTTNGHLGPATAFIQHRGHSVNPRRQRGPHAHCVTFSPDNHFLVVADLGLDKLLIYPFNAQTGKLSTPHSAELQPGAGPRHFVFHPNGRWAYVINELNCTICAFSWDSAHGRLTPFQTVSTLPADFQEKNTDAEIQIHPSGRFLYGSNRGHNSIAVFQIDQSNGRLRLVQHVSTQGKTPRHFALDPTGRFLLAENQASDNIVVFRVQPNTGRLEPTGSTIHVGAPVCVVFVPR